MFGTKDRCLSPVRGMKGARRSSTGKMGKMQNTSYAPNNARLAVFFTMYGVYFSARFRQSTLRSRNKSRREFSHQCTAALCRVAIATRCCATSNIRSECYVTLGMHHVPNVSSKLTSTFSSSLQFLLQFLFCTWYVLRTCCTVELLLFR